MTFRYAERADLPSVLRLETEKNTYREDFGERFGDDAPMFTKRWSPTYKDLEQFIKSGVNNKITKTRLWVGEYKVGVPVATVGYEIYQSHIEIPILSFEKSLNKHERNEIVDWVVEKLDGSGKDAICYVHDCDWELVKLFQHAGWEMELVKDHFQYEASKNGEWDAATEDAYRFLYKSKILQEE